MKSRGIPCVAVLALMLGCGVSLDTNPDFAEWKGKPAPDFTVQTLDGQELKLSELKGKRVVLDFWATWCPPCLKEIPHFNKLAQETPGDQLVIVGISNEPAAVLRKFQSAQKLAYPLASARLAQAPYSDITGIPTTFFLNAEGIIERVFVGYHDYEELKSAALGK